MDVKQRAKELYNQGKSLTDIANELGVSAGTVRSWKSRGKWGASAAPQRNTATQQRCNEKQRSESKNLAEALSYEHRLFAEVYAECCVAYKAYRTVYTTCNIATARVNSHRLLQRPEVKAYVDYLKQIKAETVLFQIEDVVDRMMRIAFTDISDVVEFGRILKPIVTTHGLLTVTDPATGEETVAQEEVNDVRFKESWEVDGAVISEVKLGKNGASIKLEDRMKAMQWLVDYFGHNPDSNRKTEFENRKLALQERQVKAQEDKTNPENQLEKLDDVLKKIGGNI